MHGHSDSTHVPKLRQALDIISLEKVDLLALTETHHDDTSSLSPRGCSLLAHSGISTNHAGVAIVAHSAGGWSSLYSVTLIPGYAVLALLNNRRSTESFWFLCVYANNQSNTRLKFYSTLKVSLADFISLYPTLAASSPFMPAHWPGCVAAGDWNMVEHVDDCVPPTLSPASILLPFQDVIALCCAHDMAGLDAFPRGFTRSGTHARLDRIYIPTDSWTASFPVVFPTLWSDHKFIYADCIVTRPRVEIAQAAPCLPPLPMLNADRFFWPQVMSSYASLASGPVTLERWTDFKKLDLQIGTRAQASRRAAHSADWKAALRGDLIEPDDLQEALRQAIYPPSSSIQPRPRGCRWQCAIPDRDIPAPLRRPHAPPKVTRWHCATDPSPSPPASWSLPQDVNIFDAPGVPSNPIGPWFPAFIPAPQQELADLLDSHIRSKRAYTTRKYRDMAEKRSAAWFQLSSNMEADERSSQASISVEGLRCPTDSLASTSLLCMLPIAHKFFVNLHCLEPPSQNRAHLQCSILDEVSDTYLPLPSPSPVVGPFSLDEVSSLVPKMHNTSPGPDGIPNQFWKALVSRVDSSRPPQTKGLPRPAGPSLPLFWKVFQSLTDDLCARGTDHLHFKDTNLSLFYKKGDPTLVANYRPISSMNCDCKMYTNLVNNCLSPWAVAKLHPDQKGFVKGRWITEHTCLASEVAHLSNMTGSDGYIVSLDQAKAYDRTDLLWLVRVLESMGLPLDLTSMIWDIVHGCRTHVRINSAYSRPYTLHCGVRQGDPLSCLLYAFSIEPMGMRLRRAIRGISVLLLPLAKLIMYTDDTNLFLS